MGSCIINIFDLMEYANRKKIDFLILVIDFQKAFYSLSHEYIDECLKMFNFGPFIQRWIKLFFNDREAHFQEDPSRKISSQGDVVSIYTSSTLLLRFC